jgi:tRNA threonylcarbamoyladenosine biosynthesis protein TsaE
MHEQIIYGVDEVELVSKQLKALLSDCKIMTFTGTLGAGKTTLIQALLRNCGVQGDIASPTFTYMNVYEDDKGHNFYHFDLYRIATVDMFVNAGFDEYLYQPHSWALIEWPEVIVPLLTHDVCHVYLDYFDELEKRVLRVTCDKK